MVAEAGTSKLGRDPGLHNKPLGCGASEVYASGPACEEEEECGMEVSGEKTKYVSWEQISGQSNNSPLKGWNCSDIWKQPKQVKIAPTKNFYMITLFNLVVPTCTVW